jgi:hypothetical protein
MINFRATKVLVSAGESYVEGFSGHYTTMNQLFILFYYYLYNQTRGSFRRYLSHYLVADKQELWGKNTTIYMKKANNIITQRGRQFIHVLLVRLHC